MSWSSRRAVLVLTVVAVLASAAFLHTVLADKAAAKELAVAVPIVIGPQPGTGNGAAEVTSFDLPKDNTYKRKIEAVGDYIEKKEWETVSGQLQQILEIPQDKFALLTKKTADGKEAEVPTSVRAEANRILGSLPAPALESYKAKNGPTADEMLKKAKEDNNDIEKLGTIVRNFLHTDGGAEAADMLGTYYLDRGEYSAAARYFGLLLTRSGGADVMTPQTLFRAAFAFHQADDTANEKLIWDTAYARGIREVRFGDDTRSITELKEFLGTLTHGGTDMGGRGWACFLGNPNRTGKGEGGPAFMVRSWSLPTVVSAASDVNSAVANAAKMEGLYAAAAKQLTQFNQAVLPSNYPVAAVVTMKDGKKTPLIIYRNVSGIVTADLKTGRRNGQTPMKGTLDWMMLDAGRSTALDQWTQAYVQQNQRPGMLFENTAVGTLSTDGVNAYAVEDLVVPPPPSLRANFFPGGPPNPLGWPADILEAISRNKLMAYDLAGGCKLVWEVGGGADKGDLGESYFLGPPLAVAGKLYVLNEKQQELRLVCLDPAKGKLISMLSLGASRDSKLQTDSLRRVNAAHLSYGEGVLVCPTNLGYVIGIDLVQNSLLWAYPYRDKLDEADPNLNPAPNPFGRPVIRPPGMPGVPNQPPATQWKVSAPIIQDGKVVFTAPDSRAVHCINIKDGTPAWTQARNDDDLFLGGVVNGKVIVVGKKVVRAFTLVKGESSWTVETGMPSGFGAASENTYFLPLKEAVGTKEPEICAIDVDKALVSHSKSRQKDVPGNLLFFEGAVVSQNNTEVVAYPQLKVKLAKMTEDLKANPNDPQGLFDRGELRLEDGDLEGAVDDLLHVVKISPAPADPMLLPNARRKLYDALTDYFQVDFNAAEKYQDEYESLCKIDPAAPEAEKAESRERRSNYLCLIAKGKEAQRKLVEAFDKYQEFTATAAPDKLMSLVDERLVKAAPDVLAQGRIAAMVANATEAERKPLEDRITARWREIHSSGNLEELRKFVNMFGSLFPVGQEARLELAERLMEDKDGKALIDAERNLTLLRARADNPELAARAVESLARLNTQKGLLEDAAYYYRVLRDRYPNVVVRDGRTGADIVNDVGTDKRLLPYIDEPARFGANGKLKAAEERDTFPLPPQTYRFSPAADQLPYFQRYRLTLQFDKHELKLVDHTTNEQRWPKPLGITRTGFQALLTASTNPMMNPPPGVPVFPGGQGGTQPPPAPDFSFQAIGHLVVLPVGNIVFGIDAVRGEKLWEKNLCDPAVMPAGASPTPSPNPTSSVVDPRDGTVLVLWQEGWNQRLGQTGPLDSGVVCLQMKDALVALDPVSGRTLWTRSDVGPRSHIFGDDQHIFVVEVGGDNKPSYTRVLRSYDGVSVRAPDFAALYEKRVRMIGHDLLVADADANGTTLRLYDPLSGKDVWKQTVGPKAIVMQSEGCTLAGVVEPDGLVRVFDPLAKKEILNANSKMKVEHLDKVQQISLLADGQNVYVAPNGPVAPNTQVRTNLMPGTGLRGLNVNGEFYAFKISDGKVNWRAPAPNAQVVLDQFQEMPMLLFTAQVAKFQNPWGGPQNNNNTVKVIEKRTGKLLYPNDNWSGGPFHSLEVDARNGRIDFLSPQAKVSVSLDNDKPAPTP